MDQTIDFSEIRAFADAPSRTHSTGMRVRLALGAAMSVDVLLLDEVLVVAERCDAALWLDGARKVGFGPAAEVVEAYRENAALARAAELARA